MGFIFQVLTQSQVGDLAVEIAFHHRKALQAEVTTSSLEGIQLYLSKLDFTLQESIRLREKGLTLVGGRYCSLLGRLGAQFKILDEIYEKEFTFYQVPLPFAFFFGEGETVHRRIDGVEVEIWVEGKMLMGLAH